MNVKEAIKFLKTVGFSVTKSGKGYRVSKQGGHLWESWKSTEWSAREVIYLARRYYSHYLSSAKKKIIKKLSNRASRTSKRDKISKIKQDPEQAPDVEITPIKEDRWNWD